MSTKADIKNQINRLLKLASTSSVLKLNSDTIERAYEAYIWSLCMRAVEEAGGQTVLTGILTGDNPNPIILRGAPGNMASDAQNYCYMNCQLNGAEFEVHLDVQYEGTSGATHEIDVSIYDHTSAEVVRSSKRLPKSSKLVMVIECKFFLAAPPSAAQGRGFVGLVKDFPGTRMNVFASNQATKNLNLYFKNKSNIEPFTDLDPDHPAAEDRFVRVLEQELRKWTQ